MSTERRTRLMLLAVLAGSLAALAPLALRPARYLVDQWNQDLQTLSEDQLPLRLRQLAGLGDEGLAVVVAALDNQRGAIAVAAQRVLQEQLDRWQTIRLRDSSRRVAVLARLLAANCRESAPGARQARAALATRILLWPVDRSHVDAAQLVADCEEVLRTARAGVSAPPSDGQLQLADFAPEPWRDHQAGLSQLEEATLATLPGGALRIDFVGEGSLPRAPLRPIGVREPQPQLPAAPPGLQSVPAAGQPRSATANRADGPPRPEAPSPADQSPQRAAAPIRAALVEVPWEELSVLEVMRKLQDPDQSRARAAAAELQRRNFQPLDLQIARKLFDPDPQERAKLIETLPQLAGIDSRPWLIALSRDEEPTLRRRVIAMFATSSDPALRERLREMEREESDPQTLQLVRQVLYAD